MNNNDHRCKECGAKMDQVGTEYQTAIYKCKYCGNTEYVTFAPGDNTEFLHQKNMLLGRVRKGILDWEVTNWDTLRNEIMDFMTANHAARNDIYFRIAIIACLTKGFHDLDDQRYKECKRLFKVTEKVYKRYIKDPTAFASDFENGGVFEYEEYRSLYKKCRSDYRNTKLAWKLAYTVGKKLIPMPKF